MGHTVLMQSKYLSWTMSHCWNQDGTLFSSVCSVVIGLSIFVAIVSVFCIFRITIMCRKLKKQTKEEKMKLPAQCVIWPIFGSHGFSQGVYFIIVLWADYLESAQVNRFQWEDLPVFLLFFSFPFFFILLSFWLFISNSINESVKICI